MFHSTMQDALNKPVTEPVPFRTDECEEISDGSTSGYIDFSGELQLENSAEAHFSPWALEEAAQMAQDFEIYSVCPAFAVSDQKQDAESQLLFLVDTDNPSRAIVCAPRIQPEDGDDA